MAYDEKLAERIRQVLGAVDGVAERRMFGGLCFLVNGHMCCGVLDDRVVLRLGDEAARRALRRRHVSPMDFTGRPLKSMVYVSAQGMSTEEDLGRWLSQALGFVRGLPPKTRG